MFAPSTRYIFQEAEPQSFSGAGLAAVNGPAISDPETHTLHDLKIFEADLGISLTLPVSQACKENILLHILGLQTVETLDNKRILKIAHKEEDSTIGDFLASLKNAGYGFSSDMIARGVRAVLSDVESYRAALIKLNTVLSMEMFKKIIIESLLEVSRHYYGSSNVTAKKIFPYDGDFRIIKRQNNSKKKSILAEIRCKASPSVIILKFVDPVFFAQAASTVRDYSTLQDQNASWWRFKVET